MKTHRANFTGPEVRGLLAGHKTGHILQGFGPAPCPYGDPGDRLWVRETWATLPALDALAPSEMYGKDQAPIWYQADSVHLPGHGRWRADITMPRWASRLTLEVTGAQRQRLQAITEESAAAEGLPRNWNDTPGWVGSEHGWLTPAGYHADPDSCDDAETVPVRGGGRTPATVFTAREAFRLWWDHRHGKRSPWASNPWVWAVTFRRTP